MGCFCAVSLKSEVINEDVVRTLSYKERLGRRRVYSMECKRLRGELLEVYKNLEGNKYSEVICPWQGHQETEGISLR